MWWDHDIASSYVGERLGVDLAGVLVETLAIDRRRIGLAMRGHVYTRRRLTLPSSVLTAVKRMFFGYEARPPKLREYVYESKPQDRSVRLLTCGHLRPAVRGAEIGLAHWRCRDRLCPSCAEIRARDYASAARAFIDQRPPHRSFVGHIDGCDCSRDCEGGLRVELERPTMLFCTLTQPKRPVHRETAAAAFDRLMASWREIQNVKTWLGKAFRGVFVGGCRAVELKYSPAGARHGKHHVLHSGWHPHLHCIFEVRRGVSKSDAQRVLGELWARASPGSSRAAQDVQTVDQNNIGQVCKYPLKLPPLVDVKVIREAALVLADRKTLVGFGEWRAFLKVGRERRDAMAPVRPPLHMAEQRVSTLARKDGVVSFMRRRGRQWYSTTKEVREVRDAILWDPRTFAQRDRFERKLAAAKVDNEKRDAANLPKLELPEQPPIDHERRAWWDRFAPPPTGPPVAEQQPEQQEMQWEVKTWSK